MTWAVEVHVNNRFVYTRQHKEESVARRWFNETPCDPDNGPITDVRLWDRNKLVAKKGY